MKRIAYLACCMSLLISALAGVSRVNGEDGIWKSNISLGINASRGNADSIFTSFTFDAEKKRPADILRADLLAAYGENDDETTAKEIMVSSQYNRTVTPKTFWSLMGSLEYNEISGIDYRYTIAPGYGYYFIKEEKRTLEFSGGLAYVGEKFDTGESDSYISMFLSERFDLAMANSKFWNSLLLLPEISDFSNFILKGEVGFEAGINEKLGLRLVLKDIYDNSPQDGRDSNDLMIMSLLTYKL